MRHAVAIGEVVGDSGVNPLAGGDERYSSPSFV